MLADELIWAFKTKKSHNKQQTIDFLEKCWLYYKYEIYNKYHELINTKAN
jgi:hypothetical protein